MPVRRPQDELRGAFGCGLRPRTGALSAAGDGGQGSACLDEYAGVGQLLVGHGAAAFRVLFGVGARVVELVSAAGGGGLFRIGLSDGKVRWRRRLDGRGTRPVHADGVVHLGTRAGTVLALNTETGRRPHRPQRGTRV
ncbi:PQQ-binding-like beta-propeller repeat protein [Streptomyces sp. SID8366]|nr:PQQ-binding-like beta-propeller repeat protein [Streptomyces sp. SID8366]MYU62854.1 PQQ-binding-like beta-propeller repeat protein [Streptomyces sp. SID69]